MMLDGSLKLQLTEGWESFGRAAKTRRISSSASQGAELCVFGSSTCADEIYEIQVPQSEPNDEELLCFTL